MKPKSVKSEFIREQKRYTQKELCELMECNAEEVIPIICKLKEFGILKSVRATDAQKSMSELQEFDIEVTDAVSGEDDFLYVFTFVGIIAVAGRILKCCPKYLLYTPEPKEHLKQVIKVLEKYNSKKQIVRMFSDSNKTKSFNLLAVLWFLINDYFENGLYVNTIDIIETNGTGEILWDRTVNESFAFFCQNRPYYTELQTRKRITNENDYFKRLHECVVSLASKELKNADLLDIFDISELDLSDETLDDFGETEYILYRIERELNIQFDTRKQLVLKTLYSYIAQGGTLADAECMSMFGTNSFQLVWEAVCAEIFDNKLDAIIGTLDLPVPLKPGYDQEKKLIDLIEKPYWSEAGKTAKDTLIPDLVSIYNNDGDYQFVIFDAKYYVPLLEKGISPQGQPGIESITKQYLYQLSYDKFVKDHNFKIIRNCFLFPTEEEKIINKGYVSMNMFDGMGLQKICVCFLPAAMAYSFYLSSEKIDICDLELA